VYVQAGLNPCLRQCSWATSAHEHVLLDFHKDIFRAYSNKSRYIESQAKRLGWKYSQHINVSKSCHVSMIWTHKIAESV
jgi:hypothetical protein